MNKKKEWQAGLGIKSHKLFRKSKRLRVYTIVDFSFIRTFAPSF